MRHSKASSAAHNKKIDINGSKQMVAAEDLGILLKFRDENPNPILSVSKSGQILYANEASAPILDSWKCKVGDNLSAEWQTIISKTLASGSKRQELIHYADQTFSLMVAPFVEAGYVNIYGQDVTQCAQIEQNQARWAQINERLRAFLITLNSINNIDEMMKQILDTAIEICDMDGGGIYLIRDKEAVLHIHKGLTNDFVKAVSSMPVSTQPVSIAIKSDKPVNVCDISDDISNLIHKHGIKHAFSVPLRIGNNVIGFINLASYKELPPDNIGLRSFWMLALESGSFLKRAQAEKELRNSGRRYRQLFENANEAIFVTQDGIITYANPKLSKISGQQLQNAIPLQLAELIYYDDLQLINSIHNKLLRQEFEPSTFEVRINDHSGIIRWIEIHAIRIVWDDKASILNFASEITDRKNAEEALRASEERFRLAAQSASDLVYEWDILSTTLIWHGDIDSMLGYDKGEFPRTLEGWAKNIHSDDYDRVIAAIEQSLKNRTAFSENYRIRCKNGSYRHWIDRGMAPSTHSANPFRWIRVVSDITERRKAEESLRELSSRNEALLESVPDIIMEVDKDKVYTWANEAGYEFFGKDVIGKVASYYFEGEQRTMEIVDPLFEGSDDIICIESWQRRRDGEKRLLSWRCKEFKDAKGNISGALSSARDITEHRQATEDLKFRNLLLATEQETALDGILVIGESGNVLSYNHKFTDMWGIS